MFVVEEYLAAVVVAIAMSCVGFAILLVILKLTDEMDFLERAASRGGLALPPSWPRLWLLMKVVDRWQRVFLALGQRRKVWWRRVRTQPGIARLHRISSALGRAANHLRPDRHQTQT